jgi:hypothetical protein
MQERDARSVSHGETYSAAESGHASGRSHLIAIGQKDFRFVQRFPELPAKVLVGCMDRFRAREEPTRLIAAPQSQ